MGDDVAKDRMIWSSYLLVVSSIIILYSIFSSGWISITFHMMTIIEASYNYGPLYVNFTLGGISESGTYGTCSDAGTDGKPCDCKNTGMISAILALVSYICTLWAVKILRSRAGLGFCSCKKLTDEQKEQLSSQTGLQGKCMKILGAGLFFQFLSWLLMLILCAPAVTDAVTAVAAASSGTVTAPDSAGIGMIGMLAIVVNLFQIAALVANKQFPEGGAAAPADGEQNGNDVENNKNEENAAPADKE